MRNLWIRLCVSREYPVDSDVLSAAGLSCYHRWMQRAITGTNSPETLARQAFAPLLTYITIRITKIIGAAIADQTLLSGMREVAKAGCPADRFITTVVAASGRNGICRLAAWASSGRRRQSSRAHLRPSRASIQQRPIAEPVLGKENAPRAVFLGCCAVRKAGAAPISDSGCPPITAVGHDQPTSDMRMLLWRFAGRSHTWLRFGEPRSVIGLDAQRRIAVFGPGAVCCRVQWVANAYGPIFRQLMVLQADDGSRDIQTVRGVAPGARILLHVRGEARVQTALRVVDEIAARGICLAHVSTDYWRTLDNRLAARLPLPEYTAERHAAYLARRQMLDA